MAEYTFKARVKNLGIKNDNSTWSAWAEFEYLERITRSGESYGVATRFIEDKQNQDDLKKLKPWLLKREEKFTISDNDNKIFYFISQHRDEMLLIIYDNSKKEPFYPITGVSLADD